MRKSLYLFGLLVSCFMLSSVATWATLPVILSNPHNDTVCSGHPALFIVSVSDTAHHTAHLTTTVTYQWQVSTDGGFTWAEVINGGIYSGATKDSLQISPNVSLNGNLYRDMVYFIYFDSTHVDSTTSLTSATAALFVDTSYSGAITGPTSVCRGAQITLSSSLSSGVWSTHNDSASVSLTGIVTGLLTPSDTAAGHDVIVYKTTGKCPVFKDSITITINPLPNVGVINGTIDSICNGFSTTLSDTASGGVWSTSNPAAGTVSTSGVFTSLSQGVDTIKYTVTNATCAASADYVIRVDTFVSVQPITGPANVCAGSSVHLSDANVYGTAAWSSSNATIAMVSSEGVVEGVASGVANITYAFTNACNSVDTFFTISIDTVLAHGSISGATSVCAGSGITLSDAVSGGYWLSSNSSVAIVDMSGDVTGVTQGTASISYYFSNSCGVSAAAVVITVLAPASAIIGNDSVGIGATRYLSDATVGGTWSTSDSAVISVNSTTGAAMGEGAGSATITYTVANTCGTSYATETLYTGLPTADAIFGSDSVCTGHTITLSDTVTGGVGVWSTSSTNVTVDASGTVTGVSYGPSVISYTYTNGFGPATALYNVFVNSKPVDSIGIPSIFSEGGSYTLYGFTYTEAGYVPTAGRWTSSNPAVGGFLGTVGDVLVIYGFGSTTITYSASNTCGTKDTSFVIDIVNPSGISNVANNTSVLNVYPNPSTGDFIINLSADNNEQALVTITNMVGETVKEIKMTTNQPTQMKLDEPDGVYFLTVTSSNGKYAAKITLTK